MAEKRSAESQPRHVLWAIALVFAFVGALGSLALSIASRSDGWTLKNMYKKWEGDHAGNRGADIPLTAVLGSMTLACIGVFFATLLNYIARRAPTNVPNDPKYWDFAHEATHAVLEYCKPRVGFWIVISALWSIGIFLIDLFDDYWRTMLEFIFGVILTLEIVAIGADTAVAVVPRTTAAVKQSQFAGAINVAFLGAGAVGIFNIGLLTTAIGAWLLIFRETRFYVGLMFALSLHTAVDRLFGGAFQGIASVSAKDATQSVARLVSHTINGVIARPLDILESFSSAVCVGAILGAAPFGSEGVAAPFWLGGIASVSNVVGVLLIAYVTKAGNGRFNTYKAARRVFFIALLIVSIINIGVSPLVFWYLNLNWQTFIGYSIGVGCAFAVTAYAALTTGQTFHAKGIADAGSNAISGGVLRGFGVATHNTFFPMVAIFLTIIVPMTLGEDLDSVTPARGLPEYIASLAVIGYVSIAGLQSSFAIYGAIADDVHDVATLTEEKVPEAIESLRDFGDITSASARNYASGAAILVAHIIVRAVVVAVFTQRYKTARGSFEASGDNLIVGDDRTWRPVGAEVFFGMDPFLLPEWTINLLEKRAVSGLIIGAAWPFLISGLNLLGYGHTAAFARSLETSEGDDRFSNTIGSLFIRAVRDSIVPLFFVLALPILIGFAVGPYMLVPFLFAAFVSGFMLAVTLGNSGSLWTAARRYIEIEEPNPRYTTEGTANVVVGTSVGDAFKDAGSGTVNTVIKIMPTVALLFAPAFIDGCKKTVLWESQCFSTRPLPYLPEKTNA